MEMLDEADFSGQEFISSAFQPDSGSFSSQWEKNFGGSEKGTINFIIII